MLQIVQAYDRSPIAVCSPVETANHWLFVTVPSDWRDGAYPEEVRKRVLEHWNK
jgi:hypothetical protein